MVIVEQASIPYRYNQQVVQSLILLPNNAINTNNNNNNINTNINTNNININSINNINNINNKT